MPRIYRISFATACLILFTFVISCTSTTGSSKISIKPSRSYDFGDVVFGLSATNDFIFSNKTSENVNITSTSITGTNANQFAITVGGTPTTVLTNSTHTMTVQFTPAGGTAFAVLRVNYTDDTGSNKEIAVNLHGNSIDSAALSVNVTGTPPTYDFGAVASGKTKSHSFRLTNSGNADLEIANITINKTVFFITAGFTPGNPEIIHSGDYIDVYVQFSPTTVGPVDAIFAITHDATNVNSPYNIVLKGAGGSKTF